ncbi:hypothetical protein GCM10008023_06020 [Sphingomonas glacialis]|uniref:Bacteriophage phiJL001 Gp84 C-terminal domain-containing protein n=1 Tax=Sphingomonas glacialis TaxID=658225 RepID=A0ABQ3L9D7_9SPHN|nr:DUF2163 domain-containing protein [Sphingomonas glacialis]GHH09392.1 hypothetical protein GCM10008023_06020 [Sphingomonas glacialis]
MKSASDALKALLNSGTDFEMADLWTLRLRDGTIVRWSGADKAVFANGYNFTLGPVIARGAISEKIGVDVATLDLTIMADSTDLIVGKPVIPFIIGRGLDGATVKLERAFMTSWSAPAVGTVIRFAGRVTSVPEVSGSTAQVTVSAWTILLNVMMPPHLYQTNCLHNVYDAGCALARSSFSSTGTVQAGTAPTPPATTPDTRPTQATWLSNLTGVTDKFTLGSLVFTSGANSGISRSVRSSASDGTFEIVNPLPVAPAAGDTFVAYWGCDRTSATCSGKFNNIQNFKGTEFVPSPETAL